MREYEIDHSSFIGGWYIPEKICDDLIELYQTSEHLWEDGKISKYFDGEDRATTDEKSKKNTEMYISPSEFMMIPTYLPHLAKCLDEYKKRYPYSDNVNHYSICTPMKIQYYKPGEGFYKWHMENGGYGQEGKRHLVFMTYLNTLENAGTEFYHQKITTPCEKGLTIIWPAHWTHTHKGVINHNSDKHIITGWYSFNDK